MARKSLILNDPKGQYVLLSLNGTPYLRNGERKTKVSIEH